MSAINWFEIPANDFNRAKKFYSTILNTTLNDMKGIEGMHVAAFPAEDNSTTGAVVSSEHHQPGQSGSLLYLNAGNDLSTALNRIESAGGNVLMPKTSIGEHGYIAQFIDTEGNRVALHSPN